jgi:hypothetical protein
MKRFFTITVFSLTSTFATAADPINGQRIWLDACSRCHGSVPNSRHVARGSTPDSLRTMFEGIAAMWQFRALSDTQVRDLAAYIRGEQATAINPLFNWTDIWFSPSEPGWGLSITQRPDSATKAGQVFAVLYHYDTNGFPAWYALSGGEWTAANVFTGKLYRTNGPSQSGSFESRFVQTITVGTMTLTFTDRASGRVSYQIDSRKLEKSITRTPF